MTGPITTHFGLTCAQTMPFFAETLITCPWQKQLLQQSYGRQIQWENNKYNAVSVKRTKTIAKEL